MRSGQSDETTQACTVVTVVHVPHASSTNLGLGRRVVLVGYIFIQTLLLWTCPSKAISAAFSILLRVPHSRFLCVYPSDFQLYQMIKKIGASYDAHLDLLEGRVHRTLLDALMSI
jgi:hypothetical protein